MKLKTFTFLKHKTYLFSFIALMLGSILCSLPAYSQVDYYYGINKTGVRVGIDVGAAVLQSNWSGSPIGYGGHINLDYDINLFTSIGLQGTFGMVSGEDVKNKLAFTKDAVGFGGGSIGFKVAVGQFSNFEATTKLKEALKRIYIGAGVGMVFANADLTPHSDGKGLATLTVPTLAYGKLGSSVIQTSGNNPQHFKGGDPYPFVPINIGTYIALRGLLGNDKLELNPNFQYNLVLSPLFDGYQPNSVTIPANISATGTTRDPSGNQAFVMITLGLRYKF